MKKRLSLLTLGLATVLASDCGRAASTPDLDGTRRSVPPGMTVRGRILMPNDQPNGGGQVVAVPDNPGGQSFITRAGPDGWFALTGMPAGSYDLLAGNSEGNSEVNTNPASPFYFGKQPKAIVREGHATGIVLVYVPYTSAAVAGLNDQDVLADLFGGSGANDRVRGAALGRLDRATLAKIATDTPDENVRRIVKKRLKDSAGR